MRKAFFVFITQTTIFPLACSIFTLLFSSLNMTFANYNITINQQKPFIANVQASIPVKHGKIQMANWGAPQFQNGWAHFVSDLIITTLEGKTIKYDTLGNANWILSDTTLKEVKLAYQLTYLFQKKNGSMGTNRQRYSRMEHYIL